MLPPVLILFGTICLIDWISRTPAILEPRFSLRTILTFALAVPILVAWYRQREIPESHSEARVAHSAAVIGSALLTSLLLFVLALFSPVASFQPGQFLLQRSAVALFLTGFVILSHRFLWVIDYSNTISRGTLTFFRTFVILAIVLPPLCPNLIADPVASVLDGLLFLFACMLGLRSSWIVHLWKHEKYRMLGSSILGVIISGLMLALFLGAVDSALVFGDISDVILRMAQVFAIYTLGFNAALSLRLLAALPTATAIDRRHREVDSMAEFGRLMVDAFEFDDVIRASAGMACEVVAGDMAWIVLSEAQKTPRTITTNDLLTDREIDVINSSTSGRTPDQQIRLPRRNQPRRFEEFDVIIPATLSRNNGQLEPIVERSGRVIRIPLRTVDGVQGTLYVYKAKRRRFDHDDLIFLETVVVQMSLVMEYGALLQRSLERERLRNEMRLAQEAQNRLLPSSMEQDPRYDVHAASEPAHLIGGDYYDTIDFSDGARGIIIADVSGKGTGAALYMAMLKGIVRGASGRCTGPAGVLIDINEALHGHIDRRFFVTMTCLRIDPVDNRITIARAGHCPTLIIHTTSPETAEARASFYSSPGIGLALAHTEMFTQTLVEEEVELFPGSLLLLYSDGIVEAPGPEGEEFGYDRLRELVSRYEDQHSAGNLSDIREHILNEVTRFSGRSDRSDDCTIVLLRWNADPVSKGPVGELLNIQQQLTEPEKT